MKKAKLIAKLLNAVKNRRSEKRKTTKIKVGESYHVEVKIAYHVKHTVRKDFYVKVTMVNDVWVEGFTIDAKTMQPLEEIIILRKLCIFTLLESEK